TASLATVVLERIFDGLVMLLFVFVTLPFAPLPAIYREAIIGLSALFLGALLVFFALAARPERMSRVYAWFVDRLLPAGVRPRVHGLFDRFVVGLQSLRSPRELAVIFGATMLIWLVETTKYWLVMQAFNFQVSFFVLMLMTAVVNLATTLPAAPGNVGTFHVPGILVLTQFGVAQATATSYTFVLHAALWLPITALGAYFMLRQSLSWGDIEKATHAKEPEQLPTVAAPRLPPETEPEDMSTGVRL
nr:flippase-like domain-containing protein [Chloroflexaceae bacterium]